MKRSLILLIDAIVNFILGIFLLLFPGKLVQFLGLPLVEVSFYPNILGAILFGIAVALLIENYKRQQSIIGLGLVGAIVINICGGIVLAFWLLFGNLGVSLRGYIILWSLVAILVLLSFVEFGMNMRGKK